MSILVFFIALAAALRLTRLAIQDTITQPFRDRLKSRESRFAQTLTKLLDCPWCFGFWASAAVTGITMNLSTPGVSQPDWTSATTWATYAGLTLAMSYLLGAVYSAVYTLEIYEPPGSPGRHDQD